MIDAKSFGAELAEIVKAATAPLLARIAALEGQVKETRDDAHPLSHEDLTSAIEAAEARAKEYSDAAMKTAMDAILELPELPELPDIPAMIAEAVEAAVEATPAPKDGNDGAPGEPGERGEPGRDGLDVKGLFRADGGMLVAVMSDGTTKDLGQFVGRDGADGMAGKDGADGLGFEDMEFSQDDLGRPVAKFQRGDVVKSVTLPCIIDRGVYRSGAAYEKGDAVSFGGSLWIAQNATTEKPEAGDGWRLAVKKGRDGKDCQIKAVK